MASALFYHGDRDAASAISSMATNTVGLGRKDVVARLHAAMKLHAPTMATGKMWATVKAAKSYDPFLDISSFPTLLQLIGSDGGIQHAVTTVDNWIFDSAEEYAYELTKKNLSRCCGPDIEFERVWSAYRFDRTSPK